LISTGMEVALGWGCSRPSRETEPCWAVTEKPFVTLWIKGSICRFWKSVKMMVTLQCELGSSDQQQTKGATVLHSEGTKSQECDSFVTAFQAL
jgi:hypothetical protein